MSGGRFGSSHGQLPLPSCRITRKGLLAILGLNPLIIYSLPFRTAMVRWRISPSVH
jgi:hypothetical protein